MDNVFLGSELMTVDSKWRVGIPARFMTVLRALAPGAADQLGVMLTPDRSIRLMPLPYYTEQQKLWESYDEQDEEERLLLNLSTSMAEVLALDKQNRIRLRPLMMEFCGIKGDVVIQGSLKYMQLFSRKLWTELQTSGLQRWSGASTAVRTRRQAPPTVQYLLNALPPPPGGGKPTP